MLPYALYNKYLGYHTSHSANSYLRSTFITMWEKEQKLLEKTCSHRFREATDVTQWLMEWYQVLSGNFYPRHLSFSFLYSSDSMSKVPDDIRKHEHKVICINDSEAISHEMYEKFSSEVKQAYSEVLPEKSEFEK